MEHSLLLCSFLILFLMKEVFGLKCYNTILNASCTTQTQDKAKLFKCYQNLPATIKDAGEGIFCSSVWIEFNGGDVKLVYSETENDCKTDTIEHYQRILESALGKTAKHWSCSFCHQDKCNVPASETKNIDDEKTWKEAKKEKEKKKKKSEKSTAKRCTSSIYTPVCSFILCLLYFSL